MSRCYALTSNFKPCRNYGEVLATDTGLDGVPEIYYSPTCKCHRRFFDTWLSKLQRMAHGLEFRSVFRNHIQRVVQEGIVEIPASFIQGLGEEANYDHFIYICVKYMKGFKFEWNSRLCMESLRTCWWQSRALGPVQIDTDYIVDFLHCMENPCQGFFTILETCCSDTIGHTFSKIDTLLHSDAGLIALLDSSFPAKENVTKLLQQCQREGIPQLVDMLESGEFENYILFLRKEFLAKCKRRVDGIRDELLEICWQPERVQDWCMNLEEVNRITKFEQGVYVVEEATNYTE